jgi:hypothetical protein
MPSQTLAKLHQQRAALNARIRHHETKLKGEERQRDTRRKILAGAAILDEAEQRVAVLLNALLHRFLSRPQDRALFDLPPRPAPVRPAVAAETDTLP